MSFPVPVTGLIDMNTINNKCIIEIVRDLYENLLATLVVVAI